ncbi:SDR family NAD(P)-dependent oxidoreductase [Pseudomonas sp. DR48]|uniref:SDR family NAD(P)-dependent oxidoreductase n=1 Tax=Pseudomonas sp. DR48 TaxID=2871095 RepID=UPI001C9A0A79|nr:SDR family NAD(P)-dependent oxidoreductase [Pseudomonas sp. DR48]QZP30543.1 SDR family NAD(P)-dependent oxidoreductase [Pseudomonas sp. DR48]
MNINATIVLTGATSGIGQLAAIELARRGAHLVLTARDETKAAATRERIHAAAPDARVDVHYADFSSLDSVAALGLELASQYERIDVLINNAGLHAFEQRVTVDGHAEMLAVNYLAPWLLTNILRDTLVRSSSSRIITVASQASRRSGGLDLERDLFDTAPFTRLGSSKSYSKTKLMDIMFSQELARQLQDTGVAVHCLDPGFNVTGLGRELGFSAWLTRALNWLRIGDPQRGADIIVRLATDSDVSPASGGYFSVKDAEPIRPTPPADNAATCQALWAATSALLAKHYRTEPRHRPDRS